VKTAIFVDSTLDKSFADTLVNTICCGPATKSSILRLKGHDFERIILVDGLFCSARAVWQRELLLALRHGVKVYGVASMGALRAVELQKYGMIGFGWIYDQYLSGSIFADDEVCLEYGFFKGQLIKYSYPLVEIRWMLGQFACYIDSYKATRIIAELRQLSYQDRTLVAIRKILDQFLGFSFSNYLIVRLEDGCYDIKKYDALSLVNSLYN
jgi:hypothetical protein